MNKIVKRMLIGSAICIIIGIAFLIYGFVFNENISEDLQNYVIGFAFGITVVGICILVLSIRALISPTKGKTLENEAKDERLNKINACAMALTFKISLLGEAAISIFCAFTDRLQVSQYVGFAICIQLILYLIIYFIIKAKN